MTLIIILILFASIMLIPLLTFINIFLFVFSLLLIIANVSILKSAKGKSGAIKMVVDDTMEALDEVTDVKDYAAEAVEIAAEAVVDVAGTVATVASAGAEAVIESIEAL